MKLITILSLLISSFSASAAWNEVECRGKLDGKTIRLNIEQSFPNDTHFKRAELIITESGADDTHILTVGRRSFGFNRLEYFGAGLRLDVDLWPDQHPRWGRNYDGTLLSSALGNKYIRGFRCQFPNAF